MEYRTTLKIPLNKMFDVEAYKMIEAKYKELCDSQKAFQKKMLDLMAYGEPQEATLAMWALDNEDTRELKNITYYMQEIKRYLSGQKKPDITPLDKDRANSLQIHFILGSRGIKVKRNTCLCPFHNESTPSFSIRTSTNTWKCFGCGLGGDAISLVMKLDNVGFKDAIKSMI